MTDRTISVLLQSSEPSVRLKALTLAWGGRHDSAAIRRVQRDIKNSERVRLLLSERRADGRIPCHPYAKWYGAHWVLATLAEIGYPPGDKSLIPLREQVYDWLLGPSHQKSIRAVAGRVRRCASQEANALYSMLMLGLADGRAEELARYLRQWQWPDGGWNCDKRPAAVNSSFMETLIPLRALSLHARLTGNRRSKLAAERAAEVFLKRRLFKRRSDGRMINHNFVRLHYPCYWHYDILFGLKVLAESGRVSDRRCREALALLESKRLPDGGFPAEARYYRVSSDNRAGRSPVDWGGTSKRRMNEFVTADALFVLKKAGRL
jgi:hypothetical protein